MIGGSRVESSKRRASADAATGRTRRSACRYVITAVTKHASDVDPKVTIASWWSMRQAATVMIMMPMAHTPTTITVCSTGMRMTRLRTMFGSWSSGLSCHSSTGRNRKKVTTMPTKMAKQK